MESQCYSFVIVDIDTTGFGHADEVIQLAAKCGEREFSASICPTEGLHPIASWVNGFEVVGGELFRHGLPVESAVPAEAACRYFLAYLRQQRPGPLVLLGHNIVRFGFRFLLGLFRQHGMEDELLSLVYAMSDTMPLLAQGKLRQKEKLFRKFLTGPEWVDLVEALPDSLRDCRLLDGLLRQFRVDYDAVLSNSRTVPSVLEELAAAFQTTMHL